MVRVLRRDDAAEFAPASTVGNLGEFASNDPGGPVIDVRLSGPVDELPAPVSSAVFRIVQESVTNARRHARNVTRVGVRVDVDDARVRLSVLDDGAPGPTGTPGYGIAGMIERAALLGGTCTAGRSPNGWSVTADLPRNGAAA